VHPQLTLMKELKRWYDPYELRWTTHSSSFEQGGQQSCPLFEGGQLSYPLFEFEQGGQLSYPLFEFEGGNEQVQGLPTLQLFIKDISE
jgi:hypothetical protein